MLFYPDVDGFNGSEYWRDLTRTSAPNARGTEAVPAAATAFWQWSRFSELRPDDLYAVVRLREAVFIVEQNCPYPDADGRDPNAWHLLGWSDELSGGISSRTRGYSSRECGTPRAPSGASSPRHGFAEPDWEKR